MLSGRMAPSHLLVPPSYFLEGEQEVYSGVASGGRGAESRREVGHGPGCLPAMTFPLWERLVCTPLAEPLERAPLPAAWRTPRGRQGTRRVPAETHPRPLPRPARAPGRPPRAGEPASTPTPATSPPRQGRAVSSGGSFDLALSVVVSVVCRRPRPHCAHLAPPSTAGPSLPGPSLPALLLALFPDPPSSLSAESGSLLPVFRSWLRCRAPRKPLLAPRPGEVSHR